MWKKGGRGGAAVKDMEQDIDGKREEEDVIR